MMLLKKKAEKSSESKNEGRVFYFFQGTEKICDKESTEEAQPTEETDKESTEEAQPSKYLLKVKEKIHQLINMKNVNFLLGAGVSTPAIPLMSQMIEEIECKLEGQPKIRELYDLLKDSENLEITLSKLYSAQNVEELLNDNKKFNKKHVDDLTKIIKSHLREKVQPPSPEQPQNGSANESQDGKSCNNTPDDNYTSTLKLYKRFYQKIANRNEDLARVNIFTTNYDLFNEKALDNLNINYNNGFSGGLERSFNPAHFTYTLSKKINPELKKFKALENMVYLYKLHGSVNWIHTEGNSLFEIQEFVPNYSEDSYIPKDDEHVLIYPTPHKQGQSLGRPYSDLLREFQNKLTLPNSVLFIIGYSFSDEHIDDIIYQSLTANSSLSIFIFGDLEECKLNKIDDSRIYRLYDERNSDGAVHYFEYIVDNIFVELIENKDKLLLTTYKETFSKQNNNSVS